MADHFHYARWLEELWANETRLRALAARLDEAAFAKVPQPGAWSPAAAMEHLILTTRTFLPLWDQALATAKPGKGEAKYAWWERKLADMLEPPYRIKAKTMAPFEPKSQHTKDEIVELFLASHELVKQRAEILRERDISKLSVVSPFASWMKYNIAFSFDLLLVHERRHLWQAEQAALKESGLPENVAT
jgi:hypothetical protein